ncbi:MAG TPA: putative inorganic carbon transporter subunit DabA, partial [Flavisolibacter sp.]
MTTSAFDESHVLQELKHFLPSQQALKDFIHHNTLHAFQHMKFYDAIFKASKIFGFQVHLQLPEYREMYKSGRIREDVLQMVIAAKKGNVSEWKTKLLSGSYNTVNDPRIGGLRRLWKDVYHLDLDNKVQPLLFRILCGFLDQGIAIQDFPVANKPFIESIRELEKVSPVSFFKTRAVRQKFIAGDYSITELLKTIVGKEEYFEQYLFDQQFAHPGWSGFISAVEDNPQTLLDKKIITLKELVEFELLMELDALNASHKNKWQPLAMHATAPVNLFADVERTELSEVIELWQDAFEWSYYDSVLKGIQLAARPPQSPKGEVSTTQPLPNHDANNYIASSQSGVSASENPPFGGEAA